MTGKGGPGKGTGGAVQRNVTHPSNDCMWSSVRYAARHAPQVYMFESVTGAFKIGREMMRALRDELERISGCRYTLTAWLHDGCTMGAPTSRQRYMFVAVRGDEPFAVTPVADYACEKFTTLRDAVEDLENCESKWSVQSIPLDDVNKGGLWAHSRQNALQTVDGFTSYNGPTWTGRIHRALEAGVKYGVEWPQGRDFGFQLRQLYQVGGRDALLEVESSNTEFVDRMIRIDFSLGPYATRREVYDAMHNLIAGGGTGGHLHPTRNRLMTYRELARVQGWPDDLLIDYDKAVFGKENIEAVWGKAVGCQVANHAGEEVRDWLDAVTVGKTKGEKIGDREWLIDELDESRRLRRANAAAKKAAREGAAN